MSKITIDGVEYDTADLTVKAMQQVEMMQYVDRELAHLEAQKAVLQTARYTYLSAFKLEAGVASAGAGIVPSALGETIKFA